MWSGRTAGSSLFHLPVLPPEHTGMSTFLSWIPPRSASHTLVTPSFSLSPVKTNSLNHSPRALKLPEWKQQQVWPLSRGPHRRICVKGPGLGQTGQGWRERKTPRADDNVPVTLLCCPPCFEAYLWLSGLPWGQAGRHLHCDCWQTPLRSCRWAG